MALSLLQHLQHTHTRALSPRYPAPTPDQQNEALRHALVVMLAHLVNLTQRHGASLTLALINTRSVSGLWQTLDQQALINALLKHHRIGSEGLAQALDLTAQTTLDEIFQLVDMASLGEEGLAELLEGQIEHLQGQAPDWAWQISGLTSLIGQAAQHAHDEPIDLAAGMASLTKLMQQAAHEHEDTMEHHHDIALPEWKKEGALARALAPLVALGLLALLTALFLQNPLTNNLKMLDNTPTNATPFEQYVDHGANAIDDHGQTPMVMSDQSGMEGIPLPPAMPEQTMAKDAATAAPATEAAPTTP